MVRAKDLFDKGKMKKHGLKEGSGNSGELHLKCKN
jgi:hypothetical protein